MELVKQIKELLANDQLDLDSARDNQLNDYIVAKAKKELKGKNGAISDDIVLSWARHFYLESKEDIDKEIKELGGKTYSKTSEKNSSSKKKSKPKQKQKELKMYNDKGKVVKAVQESLFG